MSNEGKKISFSFSKVKKPALASKVTVVEKEKVDFVDCFDGSKGTFSYKGNLKNEEPGKKELVIPLISTKTSSDIIKSRIEERNRIKNAKLSEKEGGDSDEVKKTDDPEHVKESSKNLEELAALEILKDLKNSKSNGDGSNNLVIGADNLVNTEDSSEADIDYDNVPVTDFGLAMLRGMGWKPNSGIGKEPRLVPTFSPKLRPKGLGLGAKEVPEASNDDDDKKSKKTGHK